MPQDAFICLQVKIETELKKLDINRKVEIYNKTFKKNGIWKHYLCIKIGRKVNWFDREELAEKFDTPDSKEIAGHFLELNSVIDELELDIDFK